jgi:hypothetical protein
MRESAGEKWIGESGIKFEKREEEKNRILRTRRRGKKKMND